MAHERLHLQFSPVKPPKCAPAHPRLAAPGVVANARHSPGYVCALRLARHAAALPRGCDLTASLNLR